MPSGAVGALQVHLGCPPVTTASPRRGECLDRPTTGKEETLCKREFLRQSGALLLTLCTRPALAARKAPPAGLGDWSSPGLAAPVNPAAPRFFKTANGVKIQELALGVGSEAKTGDRLVLDYVLRRSNGYFIYATVEGVSFQPRDIPIGPLEVCLGQGDIIPGLEEALVGMKPGAKRRVVIPPQLGYTGMNTNLQPQPPTFATKRQLLNHSNKPLLFEVQLLKIRGVSAA